MKKKNKKKKKLKNLKQVKKKKKKKRKKLRKKEMIKRNQMMMEIKIFILILMIYKKIINII